MLLSLHSKNSVFVTGLLTATSFISFSQTNKFSVSINSLTTNFNYGKLNSLLQPYKKNFRGFQAGISYQVGITPKFSIVPEIYFAIKGGSLKEHNPLTKGKSTLRLYSFETPVLARFHVKKFYFNAGPYVGYTFNGRLKTEGSETVSETIEKVSFSNTDNDFKHWEVGLLAGIGYNFSLGKKALTLDARYGYGMTSLSENIERYSRMLNISLAVSHPAKKKGENN